MHNLCDWHCATQLLPNMRNKDWSRRNVQVRVGLITVPVTGVSSMRWS